MKHRILIVLAMVVFIAGTLFAQQANHLVISEVYGGGGNSGATLKNDFIELYNPTDSIVTIDGWSVQYASAAGTSWQTTNIRGVIQSKGFFFNTRSSRSWRHTEPSSTRCNWYNTNVRYEWKGSIS